MTATLAFVFGWVFMLAWGVSVLLREFTNLDLPEGDVANLTAVAAMWFSLSAVLTLRKRK